MKRAFDLIVSVTVLLLTLPLTGIIAIIVMLKMGRPVLFKQRRPGLYGQPFILYKFRTMTDEKDEHGQLLSDTERLTSFGIFMRSLSLDELPQLLNVIKGDLSLVGPRPLLMDYLVLYNEKQKKRHTVKPGITGWAQVNGRNAITWEEKFEMDVWYAENRTFLTDMRIIFMTAKKVIEREGITEEGESTATAFQGNDKTAV
ncbi:sugar transferase [Salinicoccus sp. Marseille-QA3877]